MIRATSLVAAVVACTSCSAGKATLSSGTRTDDGGAGTGGIASGGQASTNAGTGGSGVGGSAVGTGGAGGVGATARAPILFWEEQASSQGWLATGTFSAGGKVTNTSNKVFSLDIGDPSLPNLQASVTIDPFGDLIFAIQSGVDGFTDSYDRIQFVGDRPPFSAGQTYGQPCAPDAGAGPVFTALYTGARKTDVEEYRVAPTIATYSSFWVKLSKWDRQARVIEATFEVVGTGLEGETIRISMVQSR